ncbi:MAG: hypothetical protein ABI630_02240 [Betaproteobacteria bacterium]
MLHIFQGHCDGERAGEILKASTTFFVSVAVAWLVTGLLYDVLPCKPETTLLSVECLPESLEVATVFLLVLSVPWFTLRAANKHCRRALAGAVSRGRALARFVVTSLVVVGGVFVAGSAAVLLAQGLGLPLFAGEGAARVMIVALLASGWALAGMVSVAAVLAFRRNPPCTGTDT